MRGVADAFRLLRYHRSVTILLVIVPVLAMEDLS